MALQKKWMDSQAAIVKSQMMLFFTEEMINVFKWLLYRRTYNLQRLNLLHAIGHVCQIVQPLNLTLLGEQTAWIHVGVFHLPNST